MANAVATFQRNIDTIVAAALHAWDAACAMHSCAQTVGIFSQVTKKCVFIPDLKCSSPITCLILMAPHASQLVEDVLRL